MPPPRFEITSATGTRTVPLGEQPLTVGRHGSNAIVVEDGAASRFHCVLEATPRGGVHVRDLNSTNGTGVNGQRVVGTRALYDGDVVNIGKTTLRLAGGPPQPVQPDLDPPDLDTLDESDAVEELSEDDLVEEDGLEVVDDYVEADLVAPPMINDDEFAPIAMGAPDDDAVAPVAVADNGSDDHAAVLEALVDAMPAPRVGPSDIALYNARGQVVHAAGRTKTSSHSDAVETMRAILLICLRNRATDIHLEPKQDKYVVRVRVDGVMVEVCKVSPQMGVRLAALVKVLSDIDIAQRNTVQEGHFASVAPTIKDGRITAQPHRIDYRVSFAPAMHGQKMVIRVLDATNAPMRLNDLRLPKWMEDALANAITQEAGMVLVVGPTGSGKTTSLYSLLRTIDVAQLNVMTIEDPVEIELPGVTQIPVDEGSGRSFSALLRSLLRQDPDVLLVGEVRDPETARIAMQAAITGHLVFSTLHTKDSIGTIFRLLDLGVEPYLVAQALQVVLAQRLTRQLCPFCKVPTKPTPQQQEKLKATVGPLERVFAPRGCPKCLGTGFNGRRAFSELLSVDDRLRDVILTKPTLEEIHKTLAGTPFTRLEHNGHLLVAQGVASFDEIDRAAVR